MALHKVVIGATVGGLATVLSGCGSSSPNTTTTTTTTLLKPDKCYALALSGGGDQVAWVAGVVKGLVETMAEKNESSKWNVVTGMSTGSLLASIAATYKVGDEAKMADDLDSMIKGFTNLPAPAHVSTNWPVTIDAANQSGLLNSSILTKTLTTMLSNRTFQDRMFSIGATSDETGKLKLWDESDITLNGQADVHEWVDYVRASMSSPGNDEPVIIDGEVYSAGSVIVGTDVFSAVLKCQEQGYANPDIVVDVATGYSKRLAPWDPATDDHTLALGLRGDQISSFRMHMQDISDACDAYPNVSWRYFVQPGPDGLPSVGLAYNSTVMAQMMDLGITNAKNASTGKHCSIADSMRHSKTMPNSSLAEKKVVEASKCYAMTLSGGGAKGAYEAGVLKGLVDKMSASERKWQIFTGISAGSILSAGSSLFDIGEEEAMGKFLMDNVLVLTNTNDTVGNVYINWPNASMQLTENGLFNTTPLFDSLKMVYSQHKLGNRKFTIGATEDATGELSLFDETMVLNADGSFNASKMATFVRASAAVPGVFESVKVNGKVHNDGGVVLGANVFSAVNRCKALGFAEKDIVLDLITCNSDRLSVWNATEHNHAAQIKARATTVQSFAMGMADIFDACRAYPNLGWRYYVQAPKDLPGNAASFDTKSMTAMVQVGLADGANASAGIHCSQAELFRKSNIIKEMRKKAVQFTV